VGGERAVQTFERQIEPFLMVVKDIAVNSLELVGAGALCILFEDCRAAYNAQCYIPCKPVDCNILAHILYTLEASEAYSVFAI